MLYLLEKYLFDEVVKLDSNFYCCNKLTAENVRKDYSILDPIHERF